MQTIKGFTYLRSELSQSVHDKIVRVVAENLNSNGFYVQADHIGWALGAPPKIYEHIPDIYAQKGDSRMIVEVETPDSFKTKHSLLQLQSFDKFKENGVTSYLILPLHSLGLNNHISLAKIFLKQNNLSMIKIAGCNPRTTEVKFF